MRQLSLEAKESVIHQALNRGDKSIELIAKMNNVGLSTLQKWLRCYREGAPLNPVGKKNTMSNKLSPAERFNHIIATHKLDEVSLGKYCRAQGFYSHQLTQWREELMKAEKAPINLAQASELKQVKAENKQLRKEVRYKEKALAEASALLIMKKKADLIWGDGEAD